MVWLPCETLLMVKLPIVKLVLHVRAVPSRVTVVPLHPAAAMFGTPLPEPIDATVHAWTRAAADPGDPALRVGETISGVGLASVIPHAEAVAAALLNDDRAVPAPNDSPPREGRGRMDT